MVRGDIVKGQSHRRDGVTFRGGISKMSPNHTLLGEWFGGRSMRRTGPCGGKRKDWVRKWSPAEMTSN